MILLMSVQIWWLKLMRNLKWQEKKKEGEWNKVYSALFLFCYPFCINWKTVEVYYSLAYFFFKSENVDKSLGWIQKIYFHSASVHLFKAVSIFSSVLKIVFYKYFSLFLVAAVSIFSHTTLTKESQSNPK